MSHQSDPDEPVLLTGARFDVHMMSIAGSDGKTYQREVVRHPGAVVLLPVLDDGSLVMIENQRPAVDETLLELPAGTREPGEEAIVTAARELIEETGYRAESLELVHEFYSAPGICDELMVLYRADGLTAGDPNREATETITNRIASRAEVVDWIRQGRIRDAKTLVGLYHYIVTTE